MNKLVYIKLFFCLSCTHVCQNPSNPECENFDPCLTYPKASAKINTYEFINDLKVLSDTTLSDVSIQFQSDGHTLSDNWWFDYKHKILASKKEIYIDFESDSNTLIKLYNFIPHKEDCKKVKLLDSTKKTIKIIPKTIYNAICNFNEINPLVNWYGDYEGVSTGILNKKLNIKVSHKMLLKNSMDSVSRALISFTNDTCLGIYMIDTKFGFKWFSADVMYTSPQNCNSTFWFNEIYGIVDGNRLTLRGINNRNNYEFTFIGYKK